MRIAFFASESRPFAKTGGLGDVVFSLGKELAKEGHEVIVAMPYYPSCTSKGYFLEYKGSYHVHLSWRNEEVKVITTLVDGVRFYFLQNDYYFNRPNLYGYYDDCERFAYFSLACRELLHFINFRADIVHVHDWQSAMVPALVKEGSKGDPLYAGTKFVLTIHNPAFKGMVDRYFLNDFYALPDSLYDNGNVRFDNMVSTLKSGIVYSDKITTVSPTHREELLSPYSDQRLNGVLESRRDDFVGIVNGIDTDEWDSAKDKGIAKNFTEINMESGKKACRKDLFASFNLKDNGGPTFGLVSRLSWQKGIDLIADVMGEYLYQGANLFVLGSGEYGLEQRMESLRRQYPNNCGIYIGYSDPLAHKIYAGCDFFLMPSLFEPCGISQMVSQRYATLPIVRRTGGLTDTVNGYIGDNAKFADGIVFNDYNTQGLGYGVGMAMKLYKNEEDLSTVRKNAIERDNSWEKSAKNYENLYKSALSKK